MTFFERVPLAPPDPILGLTAAYFADRRDNKVNLGVGYYRDETLHTPILKSVKEAEKVLLESEPNKEYLSIDGHKGLIEKVGALIFSDGFWRKEHGRIAGFQTVGGTGGLKIAGTFCKEEVEAPIYIPTPTWPNHRGVFKGCGLKVEEYPYYDAQTHRFRFEETLSFLEKLEAGSIVLLHACCHNPTGKSPNIEEWNAIADVMQEKKLLPLFDFAYLGFGTGVEEDAAAVRLFAERGCEMLMVFSAAKNFSLYCERVGALFIVTKNPQHKEHVVSRVKQMIRTNYSNPPKHGAAVVAHILSDTALKELWLSEVNGMRKRIHHMRGELAARLVAGSKKYDFGHLKGGEGMFCYLGLQTADVERMIAEYGLYMPRDGRINLCGLNEHNMDYVVDAILTLG